MNKRLTDDVRREWSQDLIMLQSSCEMGPALVETDELCALIESEKSGWEEVERLREENKRLKSQRDIGLKSLQAIVYYDIHPETTVRAQEAIQRIQEGMES